MPISLLLATLSFSGSVRYLCIERSVSFQALLDTSHVQRPVSFQALLDTSHVQRSVSFHALLDTSDVQRPVFQFILGDEVTIKENQIVRVLPAPNSGAITVQISYIWNQMDSDVHIHKQ